MESVRDTGRLSLLFYCGRRLILAHPSPLVKPKQLPILHKRVSIMMWYYRRLVLFLFFTNQAFIWTYLLDKCFLSIKKNEILSHSSIHDISLFFKRTDVDTRPGAAWFPLQLREMQDLSVNKMQFSIYKNWYILYILIILVDMSAINKLQGSL